MEKGKGKMHLAGSAKKNYDMYMKKSGMGMMKKSSMSMPKSKMSSSKKSSCGCGGGH